MAYSDVNRVTLLGRAGSDAELRHTGGGTAVCSFRLATGHKPKDREEITEWHTVVVWGRSGEIAAENIRKGVQVYVEGRLQTRSWESDSGRKYATEIVADKCVAFAGGNDSTSRSDRRDEPREGFDDERVPF